MKNIDVIVGLLAVALVVFTLVYNWRKKKSCSGECGCLGCRGCDVRKDDSADGKKDDKL